MDRRKLARRKEKLAEVREQQARVAHALAEKAVRDKSAEIEELIAHHEAEEKRFRDEHKQVDGGWLEVIERSRQRHRETLKKLEAELLVLQETESERKAEHRITLEAHRSSEKVTEKVVRLWREEVNLKEAKALDEVGNRRRSDDEKP